MNFLTLVFGGGLAIALLTGKAYFRGVISRDDTPRGYWTVVGCYAALAIAGLVFAAIPGARGRTSSDGVALVPSAASDFMTDGATRLARELEEGAAQARRASDGHAAVSHLPKAQPEGCSDDYKVQITKDSALVIWCSTAGKVTSSHATTSHLRAVGVPQTWIVDKKRGEPLAIALDRRGDRIVVTDVQ